MNNDLGLQKESGYLKLNLLSLLHVLDFLIFPSTMTFFDFSYSARKIICIISFSSFGHFYIYAH